MWWYFKYGHDFKEVNFYFKKWILPLVACLENKFRKFFFLIMEESYIEYHTVYVYFKELSNEYQDLLFSLN